MKVRLIALATFLLGLVVSVPTAPVNQFASVPVQTVAGGGTTNNNGGPGGCCV
jgi:hypothetical protein